MKRVRTKNIVFGVAVVILALWIVLFWLLRNPVFANEPQLIESSEIDVGKLESHVRFLSGIQPSRNYVNTQSLAKAENYIADQLTSYGYQIERQEVEAKGKIYHNVIARYGSPNAEGLIVVGAHYDVAGDSNPGADDNASGVASLLELARLLCLKKPVLKNSIELVAYTLEEPPFFGGQKMGSAVHAQNLKAHNINVKMMLSLEMLGYYSDESFSQDFPLPVLRFIYPSTGNFIALIGLNTDRALQRQLKKAMNGNSTVPAYSMSALPIIPGVDLSDHYNYWEQGWPAFMLTDTAQLRNKMYHQEGDTPDRLNYQKMAEVTRGVYASLFAVE